MDVTLARGNLAEGGDELSVRGFLEDVAGSAGSEGLADVAGSSCIERTSP